MLANLASRPPQRAADRKPAQTRSEDDERTGGRVPRQRLAEQQERAEHDEEHAQPWESAAPFGPVALPGSDQLKLDTSIVDVDHGTSRTDQHTVKGGLLTDSKVTLSGIKLVGGLIQIKTLVSESQVTDDANGKRIEWRLR